MNWHNSKLALVCVLILLFGAAKVAMGASNDDCIDAKPIGDVSYEVFDTRGATSDGPGICTHGPNVWFCYTAPCTGEVTASLEAYYDTKLAVYNGCDCDLTTSDLIECNDDFGDSWLSQITFSAVAGNQYLIEIGGYQDYAGDGFLHVNCVGEPGPPPTKDDCANAQVIGDVSDLEFDTTEATFDGPGLCMTSPNIWYVYQASCTGEATVSLLGSSFDTMLAVYNGNNCDLAEEDMIACNDDFSPERQSQITFETTAGNLYLIEIGGYGSNTGEGVLNISCEPSVQPSKDDCANAQAIGEVKDMAFDTTDATFDGPGLCMTSPNIWFVYTASCTGNATVSLLGSSYDTMLAVYEGDDCDLASKDLIACNDDAPGVYQSEITFAAKAGDKYLIEIGGYGSNTGQGMLNIICETGAVTDVPDLGDAPDSSNNIGNSMTAYPKGVFTGPRAHFPTVYNDGSNSGPYGPVHLNDDVVAYLGKQITRETEADSGSDEDGVNNITPSSNMPDNDDGDDGIDLPLNLPDSQWTTFEYTVNVIDPSVDLWVNVWLDWNRDGDWDDTLDSAKGSAPEWAVQNQLLFDLPIGSNKMMTPAILSWHPEDGPKEIWMRITLSEEPWKGGSNPGTKGNAGSGPQGKYLYGETEDYYFTPDLSYTICQDFNGDGVVNTDDLVEFTANWLEDCPE